MSDLGAVSLWLLVEALKALPLFAAYFIGKHVGRRSVPTEGNQP